MLYFKIMIIFFSHQKYAVLKVQLSVYATRKMSIISLYKILCGANILSREMCVCACVSGWINTPITTGLSRRV